MDKKSNLASNLGEIVGLLTEIRDGLSVVSSTLAQIKEERESSPHTPYKEKGEVCLSPDTDARTREGIAVPTLDEVKSYAAAALIAEDVADDFYNYCDAMGWRYKGNVICNWRAMLKAWQRARKRFADRDAKITAHIDAKMDAREKKRETQMASRRHADNWIAATPEQIKEFCDGLR